jgi:DNA-binding winged helix-turn-helix (wHTH) protein
MLVRARDTLGSPPAQTSVSMDSAPASGTLKFGDYELDVDAGELRRKGIRIKLQPQPFKVLVLLASHAGRQVTRDEIRRHVWGEETFVDFDQGMNFCIKQVREALQDVAERPVYIETIPRRGYRFRVPVAMLGADPPSAASVSGSTTMRLQKILWTNIAELRLAEARRHRYTTVGLVVGLTLLAIIAVALIFK